MAGTDTESYRTTTYTADKKNSARWGTSSGKAIERRNSTQRTTQYTCPAKILIQMDECSFYGLWTWRQHTQETAINGSQQDHES